MSELDTVSPLNTWDDAVGSSRRSFLRLGGMFLGGLSLPQLLAAEQQSGRGRSQKAVIMIFLSGGPPHQDMVDLKPEAPAEIVTQGTLLVAVQAQELSDVVTFTLPNPAPLAKFLLVVESE